ncbi:MAG: hypothetical protein M3Q34_00100 [bacterium]|nr:hypothetical protein [bacterium]
MKNTIKNLIILGALAGFVFATGSANAQYNYNNTVIPGATEAILNASINPNGTATSAWFEYGTDVNMNYFSETPHTYVGSYVGEIPFSYKVLGLNPNNVYYYRAVASNGTVAKGETLSFTTTNNNNLTTSYVNNTTSNTSNSNTGYTNNVPTNYNNTNTTNTNSGVSVGNITSNGAILSAVLTNPNRQVSQGYFEWGPTTAYGNTTPMTDLGTSYSAPFSNALTQLNPNSTYHFRAVAVVGGRTLKGGDRSFQTYSTNVTAVNTNYNQQAQAPMVTTNQGQLITNPVFTTNTSNTDFTNTDTKLAANPLFGANFLPNNIFGWLLLLLVILAVVWVIRRLAQPTTYVVQR